MPRHESERILIVDDSPDTLEVLRRNLTSEGYRVLTAPGASQAVSILEETPVDLVITDLKMPKIGGMDVVRYVRENHRDTAVMIITGYPSIGGAVEAVKAGAEDYLSKPFTDEELVSTVSGVLEKLRLRRSEHESGADPALISHGIAGKSPPMRKVFLAIRKAASASATVLITGESGTGKELVARAIHYASSRASAPFVPVNCGGIPEGLIESELFGHVRGAFTGATESRAGFFHSADGGTIFLDEIGEMSLAMQVKLLRVLEEKEVRMVGSDKSRRVDVRILVATHKNLAGLVKRGAFREDLFYRLNVVTIAVPPLRERGDDILLLAHHFANAFAEDLGRPAPRFSDEVLQALRNYQWPGNVRELQNVIQRLLVMADGDVIEAPDLPSVMRFSIPTGQGCQRTLAQVEAEHIRAVLSSVEGNKTRAAQILGIDRKTLRKKLRAGEQGPT